MVRRDPEAKAQELITEMDRALQQAESLIQRTDGFYKELGVRKGASRRYLDSAKVPPTEKEKIQKEIAAFHEEVEREVQEAQERVKAREQSRSGAALGMGKMRV